MKEPRKFYNWKFAIRGVIIFFIFTIIGLMVSFLWRGSKKTFDIFHSMDWRFFIPILILTVFDWVLTGYRISIFTSRISSKVKFWDCFKAGIAGTFIATITPSQMGGWMGQLYILYRAGLPWSGGTVIIVIKFFSTLISLFFSFLFVIVFFPQLFIEKIVIIMQYSFIV
ncbi:MAG: hypothetical protein QG588_493, partial [Candidatus Poribacteria bacterium]|nr:hypothetical protein [Candidatus Poribacteria bacterium]